LLANDAITNYKTVASFGMQKGLPEEYGRMIDANRK
jgi:hypothetical protein